MRIVIGTGWYSDDKKRNPSNSNATGKVYEKNWFSDIWIRCIEKYIKPKRYFIYSCDCEIYPEINDDFNKVEFVISSDRANLKDHRYDYHAALLMGATYAFSNSCNYLWIEQDCIVYGLDKALEFAKDKNIVYGYGKQCSYSNGWAAQSFIWVNNSFLPEFISKLCSSRIHETVKQPYPEVIFHVLFKDSAFFWEYGFDRKPLQTTDLPYFYKQQPTDEELNQILKKIFN